ncbi:MAG: group II intron reverse transcriptase/maturase [Rikenellaceae bacterium]
MPVLVSKQQKNPKQKKLRHIEYYNLQDTFDKLYADSQCGKIFDNLSEIIASDENIKLAYRNIKRNGGSYTGGVDNLTIEEIERIPSDRYVQIVKTKLSWYKPKAVRRVEIPKPNGKTRPLGIPTIWDRIVQQCILQVLEPICEAKFYKRSYGFRPNRSAENAIADSMRMIQHQNLHFVVDIDIKGFFDNVNHSKLIKQMWKLGIRDKKLICTIKEMLKAPIVMPNNTVIYPDRGTPQGGILSPLLSNIVLNELDWWIATAWEEHPTHYPYKFTVHKDGSVEKGSMYKALRKSKLKEMYIVRYADDFKIYCRKKSDADKAFVAIKQWLNDRLKLEVSDEKSKVVNLKKGYSEFLGFKMKAVRKRDTHIVSSHMCDKAVIKVAKELKEQIKKIEHPKNLNEAWRAITQYNSMVIGVHNYYQIATQISTDLNLMAREINCVMLNRLRKRLKRQGSLEKYRYIRERYGKSAQMRFVDKFPVCPIGYIKTKPPTNRKRTVNKYTKDGREEIHKNLNTNMSILRKLMQSKDIYRSVEFMDNRISLYAAQYGKCAVTGKILEYDEIHCHHKKPKEFDGTDKYNNLIIVHINVHYLIHASNSSTIQKYIDLLQPNESQLQKINKLRIMAKKEPLEN